MIRVQGPRFNKNIRNSNKITLNNKDNVNDDDIRKVKKSNYGNKTTINNNKSSVLRIN